MAWRDPGQKAGSRRDAARYATRYRNLCDVAPPKVTVIVALECMHLPPARQGGRYRYDGAKLRLSPDSDPGCSRTSNAKLDRRVLASGGPSLVAFVAFSLFFAGGVFGILSGSKKEQRAQGVFRVTRPQRDEFYVGFKGRCGERGPANRQPGQRRPTRRVSLL